MDGPGAPEVPEPVPCLEPVFEALARMGRDAGGSLLHSERVSWLDENRVFHAGEREVFHFLFDAAEAERAKVEQERRDEIAGQ